MIILGIFRQIFYFSIRIYVVDPRSVFVGQFCGSTTCNSIISEKKSPQKNCRNISLSGNWKWMYEILYHQWYKHVWTNKSIPWSNCSFEQTVQTWSNVCTKQKVLPQKEQFGLDLHCLPFNSTWQATNSAYPNFKIITATEKEVSQYLSNKGHSETNPVLKRKHKICNTKILE